MLEWLLVALFVAAVVLLPTVFLLRRRDEIPPGVLWSVIICQWLFPVLGWFVAVWAASHDFGDWRSKT